MLTPEESKELDILVDLKYSSIRPLSQEEFERKRYLYSKKFHNACVNPHCIGYHAEKEDETYCPECEYPLHKK